ncbi:MAG: VWA domain-containing protein [Bryobacteraceae bacterium]|jgi:VWFA-related protein
MRTDIWRPLSIALVCASLLAQQQQSPDAPAKFETTAQLVVLDVNVTDKSGKPIEGLTAKDFTVAEDGVPQTIKFCEPQKMLDTATPPPVAAAPAKSLDSGRAKVDPVTAVQIATEPAGDIRYRDRRLLVLYFDMGAMPPPDQLRAESAAITFVSKNMQGPDLMAVMSFSDGVHVLQDFTDDKDQLLKVINKLFIGDAAGFDQTTADDSSADTGTAFGEDDTEFNLFNTNRQLAALQTAVKMLGALNEKKALVYFASGLNLNGVDNQAQFQSATNAAVRANVTIFAVDSRGLVAQPPLGDATHGSPGGLGMYNGNSAMVGAMNFQKTQDSMYALATDTGGKALLDNNDLGQGIIEAEQSIGDYYILGYYSSNTKMDGKYRRIKLTYNGDPSAKVSYRQGYFGPKLFSKFTSSDKEMQLHDALMLGDPITELTMQMEVNYFEMNSAEYTVPVTAKIPGSELALAKKGGYEHTVIEFMGEVKDEYSSTVTNVRDTYDIKLTGETAAQLAKQPIQYDTVLTLLPGTYTIKLLARDDETGHIGTYMKKFVIPNLAKEQKRIPISSVVLSGQRLDVRNALINAKMKQPTVSPLVEDGIKLLPSVTDVFSRSRDMYVYLQAYEPGAATAQPLVAFVTFYRGDQKAFETAPLPVTEAMANKLKTMAVRFQFPLSKLSPGKYNCQVTVLDPAANKAAFWQQPVMLVQ